MSLVEAFVEDLLVPGAVAQGDGAVARLLREQPRLPGALFLEPMGGLLAAEAGFPISAGEVVRRLTARYGAAAVARLRAADARVLLAVRNAREVRTRLDDHLRDLPIRTHEVAYRFLLRAIDAHEFGYHDALAALALGDGGLPAGRLDDLAPPVTALATVADVVWDAAFADPAARTARILAEADSAQQLADTRVMAGQRLLGSAVARLGGETISTTVVLAPVAGTADADLAIAHARVCGQATAVVRVSVSPALHVAYAVSRDFTYAKVLSTNPIAGTELHATGSLEVVALTTKEGHVLVSDLDGRYFGLLGLPHRGKFLTREFPEHDPAPCLQADLALAALQGQDDESAGEVYRHEVSVGAVFAQTALDYTVARLASAQRALEVEVRRFTPPDRVPAVSPEAGGVLRTAVAQLRQALADAAVLAAGIGDRSPTEPEQRRAAELTAAVGRLVQAEPMALAFVRIDLDEDATPTDAAFEDLLVGLPDGEAAARAGAEAAQRSENVDTVRAYLLAHHPEAARRLAPIHPDVLEVFTADQRRRLELEELGDALRDLAGVLGMSTLGLVPLVLGLVSAPAALAAGGLMAAYGLLSVPEGFEAAEQLAAMAALDVPGGFQLASAEEASSARRWAWIGLGLCVVDLVMLRADLGKVLRQAATGNVGATSAGAFRPTAPGGGGGPVLRVRSLIGPLTAAKAVEAAELANRQRLATSAFKALSRELRMSQRALRLLVTAAVDEAGRLAAVAALRRAAAELLSGGSAAKVDFGAVLRPATGPEVGAVAATSRLREFLVVGESEAGLGWGLEQLIAGRRATAVAATRTTGVDAFVAKNGRFVQGAVADLPQGYQCTLAREDLLHPAELPAVDAFVTARVDRLRQGGQWMVVTESPELAASLTQVGPRPGVRVWSTEYTTFQAGAHVPRYVVVIAKPRPTSMTALTALARPQALTDARIATLVAELSKPENAARMQRKLGEVWHQGMVDAGQVADWQLKNLTGNIGEILSDAYQAQVLAARRAVAETAGATLHTGVRRLEGATGASKEFTDNLIAAERDGNLYVLDVFEVKAGPRGGQEAATQFFEWMEGELEAGDRIVAGGKEYLYSPGSPAKGQIIGLGRAQRHIVVAKGAETAGRRTADVTAAPVVRRTLSFGGSDVTAADIRYLARRVIEGLPPAP